MAKPTGVRITRPDQEPIECDDLLIHEGVDADGIDHWRVPYIIGYRPGIDELGCEFLPGRTSIGLTLRAGEVPTAQQVTWREEPTGRIRRKLFGPRDRRWTIE